MKFYHQNNENAIEVYALYLNERKYIFRALFDSK